MVCRDFRKPDHSQTHYDSSAQMDHSQLTKVIAFLAVRTLIWGDLFDIVFRKPLGHNHCLDHQHFLEVQRSHFRKPRSLE